MSEEKLTEETLKAQEEEKERQRWLQVKYVRFIDVLRFVYTDLKRMRKATLREDGFFCFRKYMNNFWISHESLIHNCYAFVSTSVPSRFNNVLMVKQGLIRHLFVTPTAKSHLHWVKINAKANFCLRYPSLFNVDIHLDFLWPYLEAISLSYHYRWTLTQKYSVNSPYSE